MHQPDFPALTHTRINSIFMTLNERSEIVTALYRLQCDLAVLNMKCRAASAVVISAKVSAAHAAINEALDDVKPDDSAVPYCR
jgi:hypothetical protein